jgi:hypothetical protein
VVRRGLYAESLSRLNAANTYTGPTVVSNGLLGGAGSIAGMLDVQAGGTLAPGIPAVAPLTPAISILTASNTTISGTVLLKVDRSATPTRDQLAAPSVLATVGSRLIVTYLGATNFAAGDKFTLFSAPISGAFSSIHLPPLPAASLAWVNSLAVDGSIAVASVVSTVPPNLVAQVSANALTLAWPAAHTGWRLQMQTNSLTTGLSTNWHEFAEATSTNQVTVPMASDTGAIFFRLLYP